MSKRLVLALFAAFIPIVILGVIFPDKLLKTQQQSELYGRNPGADIVVFVRDGCPHCADFEEFAFEQEWTVDYHEITEVGVADLFSKVQDRATALQQGVPTIIIDGKIIQGYETHETTGTLLKNLYDSCKESEEGCLPFDDFLASDAKVDITTASGTCTESCEEDPDKYVMDLWIFGEVNLIAMSLPALSILLGFLDGFNPCAMWVLITLLTLLINTHDMRKVWVVGGTFLFVSGAIYYLFIAAWLNVFLLIGFNAWVQKVIAIVAIGGGGFYLYEAFGKDPNQCNVTDLNTRRRTIEKMKKIMEISAWPMMILGVSILAISVNMIELVCTAGLPAVFTQILAFNDVTHWARYGYIGLFILMYMIDDLVIFGIAVATLHASGLTTKYRRFTLIFGGALMYTLGLLLMFWPDVLTFG